VPPNPPSSLSASAVGDCIPAINVTWQGPSGPTVTQYNVTCVSSTISAVSQVVPASGTSMQLNVTAGAEYFCSAVSIGPSGQSAESSSSSATYLYVIIL